MGYDGITYRTDNVGGVTGAGGGSGTGGNLTPVEVDLNFWELYTRLKDLEDNPPEAISIANITVIGSQFEVNLSNGDTLGPYDLPIATFHLLGEWVNDFPYAKLDFFTVAGSGLYMVLIDHTSPASPAEFDANAIDEDTGSPTFGLPLYQFIFGDPADIYDMGFFFPGTPGQGISSGEAMFGHVFTRQIELPADLPLSVAKVRVAFTSAVSFDILQNATTIGTLDFAPGDFVGTFDFPDDITFVAEDLLTFVAPTVIDATAKELRVTLRGTRQDF